MFTKETRNKKRRSKGKDLTHQVADDAIGNKDSFPRKTQHKTILHQVTTVDMRFRHLHAVAPLLWRKKAERKARGCTQTCHNQLVVLFLWSKNLLLMRHICR